MINGSPPTLGVLTLATPALLAAAALVALPIVAHLVGRAAGKSHRFPSLMLLAASTTDAARRGRPTRWWLLLLRCLAVLLIVLGFAQPRWWSAATTSHGRIVTALVLDASASTGHTADGVPAFDAIRAAALNQLDTLPADAPVDVILAGNDANAPLPRPTANRAVTRDAIDRAEATHERADLGAAVALAHRRAKAQDRAARVVLITDGQARNLDAAFNADALRTHPDVIVPVASNDPGNVALHRPTVWPAQPRRSESCTLRVTAVNHATTSARVTVVARTDTLALGSTTATLPPDGQATLEVPARLDRPGHHAVTFTLAQHADALAADDAAYLTVRVQPRRRVLLVTPGDPDRLSSAAYFLLRSLTPLGPDAGGMDVTTTTPQALTRATLRGIDAVVLHRPDRCPPAVVAALAERVRDGLGLVVLMGRPGTLINWAQHQDTLPLSAGDWVATHPTQQPRGISFHTDAASRGPWSELLDPRSGMTDTLTQQLHVSGRREGSLHRNAVALITDPSGGVPVLARQTVGLGRVLQWSPPIDPATSDLLRAAVWVPLLHTMLADADPLTTDADQGPPPSPGPPATRHVARAAWDASGGTPSPTVVAPDGKPVHDATLTRTGDALQWSVDRPRQLGHYRLMLGNDERDALPMNLDPRESDLQPADDATLAALTRAGINDHDTPPATAAALTGNGRGREAELWGWLILLGLAALAGEMLLAAKGDG